MSEKEKNSLIINLLLKYFKPSSYIPKIDQINWKNLYKINKKIIFCDLDNTLVTHFTKFPNKFAKNVILDMEKNGFKVILVSNNSKKRVSHFANLLNIDYIYSANKPFTYKIKKYIKQNNLNKDEIVMIGDLIVMDIICANFLKIDSILVKPILSYNSEDPKFLIWLEKYIFQKSQKNNLISETDVKKEKIFDDKYEIL